MAKALEGPEACLITLENDAVMADRARNNFMKAGLEDRIEIRVGDAFKTLKSLRTVVDLEGAFDLVFLDIEKKDYIRALPHCETLLRKGGLLLADNVAFKGSEDFNRALYERPGWRSVHLYSYLPFHSPDMDGLCLALRV